MGSHGAPRAHAYEERSGEVRPGLYEREREREREYTIIWNYQIILALFLSFFVKESITPQKVCAPLMRRSHPIVVIIFFIISI